MEQDYEKPRIGFARNHARNLLKKYQKATRSHIFEEVPITEISKFLGFRVELLESMDDSHSAIIYPEGMLIGLNARHHPHRQRFSLGHELGHHVMSHPPEWTLSSTEGKVCNQEADEFSGELLVPLDLLKRALTTTKTIPDLANLFNVSQHVVTIRLLNHNLLKQL